MDSLKWNTMSYFKILVGGSTENEVIKFSGLKEILYKCVAQARSALISTNSFTKSNFNGLHWFLVENYM